MRIVGEEVYSIKAKEGHGFGDFKLAYIINEVC